MKYPCVAIEPLDRRLLNCVDHAAQSRALAVAAAVESAENSAIKINFAPASAPAASGYLTDSGKTYASRGNGYSYGWDTDNSAAARDRNSSTSANQAYDTLIQLVPDNARTWRLTVPNGTYRVRLVAGDATYSYSVFKINLEGKTFMNAQPSANQKWIETTGNVTISDGTLTMTAGSSAVNPKVNFLEVSRVDDDTPTPPPPTSNGTWRSGPRMPVEMAEVASAVVDDKLFVVGSGTKSTVVFDLKNNKWLPLNQYAQRPVYGDHHAIESYNGKLYVIGGLLGAGGKVQIFDPKANKWTTGASMPWDGGAVATSLINGKIYAAGGVIGSTPTNYLGSGSVNKAAVYDIAQNKWTLIASEPLNRHHTATATDGKKMYVFGGRTGQNNLADGFKQVQVYDPATNKWTTSDQSGSNLKAIPTPRSGYGKAVFVNGEFYLMGGETKTGQGAINQVYKRVDIYKLSTNTWRTGPSMPTQRHGSFPTLYNNKIYLAGGGEKSGIDRSNLLEIFSL